MDGIAARELEFETDRDMKLVDSPLLVAMKRKQEVFLVGFVGLCTIVVQN